MHLRKRFHHARSPGWRCSAPHPDEAPHIVRSLLIALALASGSAGARDASLPNPSERALDLQRYGGEWHEIAHLPMYFQRKCVAG